MFLPILAAILTFASYPPLSWSYFTFVALVPLFVFLVKENRTRRIIAGVLVHTILLYFFIYPFILEPLDIATRCLIVIPFIAAIVFLKRFHFSDNLFLVLSALAYFIYAVISAWYTPLPSFVSLPGLPLANTLFLPLSVLWGMYGLAFFAMVVNTSITLTVLAVNDVHHRSVFASRKFITPLLFATLTILAGAYESRVISAAREANMAFALGNVRSNSETMVVVVSTGPTFDDGSTRFDEYQKDFSRPQLKNFINATLNRVGEKLSTTTPASLVILPENMFDFLLVGDTNQEMKNKFNITSGGIIFDELQTFAKENHIAVLSALHTIDATGSKRQTAFLIDVDGHFIGISQKYHMTIASEVWPFGHWLPFYWQWGLAKYSSGIQREAFVATSPTGQYSPATEPFTPLTLQTSSSTISLGLLICGDGLFPDVYATLAGKGVEAFVSINNNTWVTISTRQYREGFMLERRVFSMQYNRPILISGKREIAGILYPDGRFEGIDPKSTDTINILTVNVTL